MENAQQRIQAAVAAFARGELVIVADDDDRENEGDLFVAASHVHAGEDGIHHPPHLRHRLRSAGPGRGAAAASRSDGGAQRRPFGYRLHGFGGRSPRARPPAFRPKSAPIPCGLSPTAIAVPLISCARAMCFRWWPSEGGVLMRSGHTEACVDLCRLAGLPPVGVLVGTHERRRHRHARRRRSAPLPRSTSLKRLSIADLIAYRQVAREIDRARRRISGRIRDRNARRLCFPDTV